ncbi:unnamed protein product [Orchesella dallaii]|uniref:Uncharacterized protein n=1 Tax=Orchesella dallaii TaxID=48710 RepID=A0ABP1S683_9HEXA
MHFCNGTNSKFEVSRTATRLVNTHVHTHENPSRKHALSCFRLRKWDVDVMQYWAHVLIFSSPHLTINDYAQKYDHSLHYVFGLQEVSRVSNFPVLTSLVFVLENLSFSENFYPLLNLIILENNNL